MKATDYQENHRILIEEARAYAARILGMAAEQGVPESLTRKMYDLVAESYVAGGCQIMQRQMMEEIEERKEKGF